jgi:hypothetical protein
MTPGVINFVYWNGKPALIKEINAIKQFLNEYENVGKTDKLELNQRVKLQKGLSWTRREARCWKCNVKL